MAMRAVLHREGKYNEAFTYCSEAAELGDTNAQYNLGLMYAHGDGVPQDYAEAVKWYRKAAEQGHAVAQYILGVGYANGKGIQQNYAEAVTWFCKAAEHGLAGAQFNLALMYANGEGILIISGAAAADWFYMAGLSYLKEGKKDDALRCVEKINDLQTKKHLNVPNAFLADKLLTTIYEDGAANASLGQEEKSEVKQEIVSWEP